MRVWLKGRLKMLYRMYWIVYNNKVLIMIVQTIVCLLVDYYFIFMTFGF